MRTAARATQSFSLDREILAEVKRTRGTLSQSEGVNRLLRLALDLERRAALDRESASFYASAPADRAERQAFQSAARESLARDCCPTEEEVLRAPGFPGEARSAHTASTLHCQVLFSGNRFEEAGPRRPSRMAS